MKDHHIIVINKEIESLPAVLNDERIHIFCDSVLLREDQPVSHLMGQQKQMSEFGCLHTLAFFLENEIGASVYPFDPKKYLNTYSLKRLPNWSQIRKFSRIFPDTHILSYLHKFSKFEMIRTLDEKIKYTLLKGFITQIDICIYYLPEGAHPESLK